MEIAAACVKYIIKYISEVIVMKNKTGLYNIIVEILSDIIVTLIANLKISDASAAADLL